MKKKIMTLLLAIGIAVSSFAQFGTADLAATGLTCAMCSNSINKALLKLPFVENVKADIKNSSFHINFKPGQKVDIDAIKAKVEDAGFFVGSLKLTGQFSEVAIGKDKHVLIGDEAFHFVNADDQTLNGEKTITVVDRNFVSAKQFKKMKSATTMNCLETGKAEACCKGEGISAGTRVYHVTI